MGKLHDLLGISASASTAELKREYEQAMARASRALDHQRALALSTAFDQLSPEQRGEIFGRTVSRSHHALDLPASGWASVPSSAPTGRPRRGSRSDLARRILVGAAVASIVALLAGWLWAQKVESVPAAPLSPPGRQSTSTVSVTIETVSCRNGATPEWRP